MLSFCVSMYLNVFVFVRVLISMLNWPRGRGINLYV